jgi:hypothetical protein
MIGIKQLRMMSTHSRVAQPHRQVTLMRDVPLVRLSLRGALLTLVICIASACSWMQERAEAADSKRIRDEAFAKFDTAQCKASGGKVPRCLHVRAARVRSTIQ